MNVDKGDADIFSFCYTDGNNGEFFGTTAESIIDNSLADARCVMYIGCSTACPTDDPDNLVNMTYSKGAHFVLGTTETVYTPDSDDFLEGFLEKLNSNGNIAECIERGLVKAGDLRLSNGMLGSYPITYVGDVNQYLN